MWNGGLLAQLTAWAGLERSYTLPSFGPSALPISNKAVFVDGCFWHGCRRCGHAPRTNAAFWEAKIERNRDRDLLTTRRLRRKGLRVLRFWEHELHDDLERCISLIAKIRAH
jgi:G:T-mismatch repair DNA endonuclease (very short patch repair protein)